MSYYKNFMLINPSVTSLSLDHSNQPDSPNGKRAPAVLLSLMAK